MSGGAGQLAILGGPRAVTRPQPRWPVVGELEVGWMEEVVRSGSWGWMGPHERAFCQEFADFLNCRYCVGMANGTVALQCALQAAGVRPGDEVIVPGLTWVATAQAALDIGADVVFVDIDPETWCIDPRAIELAVTERTRAVIPVHLFGCMCDMDALREIAQRRGLRIVEDAAHQVGSAWRGASAGALGEVGTFSFQRSKILSSGEGGALITDSPEIHETAFCLKHVGWKPDLVTPGGRYGRNFRLTEMQAVLLRGGLRRLPEHLRRREEAAAFLSAGLERLGGPLRSLARDERVSRQAFYALSLRYRAKDFGGIPRSLFMEALEAEGVRLFVPYAPAYRNPLTDLQDETSSVHFHRPALRQDYAELRLPVTERVAEEEGAILLHQWLLAEVPLLAEVLTAVEKVYEGRARLAELASRRGEGAASAVPASAPAAPRSSAPVGIRRLEAAAPAAFLAEIGAALRAALLSPDRSNGAGRLLGGEEVSIADLERELPPRSVAALEACGLLDTEGSRVRTEFRGRLIEDLLVVSDPHAPLSQRAPFYLDPLWEAPKLARMLVRGRAGSGLDMGCGSGALSLVLSRHCDRVTGVDVSARAVGVARFNALLNAVTNVEFLQGDLFAPVADRRFDRIAFNSPTNDEGEEYRDLLHTGESLLRRFFAAVPSHLGPDGYCQVNLGMLDRPDESFLTRLRSWIGNQEDGLQILILRTEGPPQEGSLFRRGWLTLRRGQPSFIAEIEGPPPLVTEGLPAAEATRLVIGLLDDHAAKQMV